MDRHWYSFRVAVENNYDVVFIVRMEISCFFVSGHQNRLDFRVEIKIDSVSSMGFQLNRFLRAGSKLT